MPHMSELFGKEFGGEPASLPMLNIPVYAPEDGIAQGTGQASPSRIDERKLLNEFKAAAQSLINVWSEGEKVDYPEELQKHIDWFKELLA